MLCVNKAKVVHFKINILASRGGGLCCGGVCTCGGRSNIEWQALDTTLCVTTSDPEAVDGERLQVSHRQPAACCCTSIQHRDTT